MIILSIETSCDETAVSLIDASGGAKAPIFVVLGNALYSQAETHAEFGGVFPMLAKREHAKNMIPMFASCIEQAKKNNSFTTFKANLSEEKIKQISAILEREPGLTDAFLSFVKEYELPTIDAIAVTTGPGLEPALWVGVNFAKALSLATDKPIIPVNHMEGHIVSVLAVKDSSEHIVPAVQFPALALLISGGHTELVHIDDWHQYTILGATKDDAVGEAFDKVARLLDLPYPGGPKISKLAAESREQKLMKKLTEETGRRPWTLPRPMIKSDDFDFSFSGLKTSVLYAVKQITEGSKNGQVADASAPKRGLTPDEQATLAEEFEDAITEVLVEKTKKALDHTDARTLILGGGVTANVYLRKNFEKLAAENDITLFVPSVDLSTDNSVMIGIAGYLRYMADPQGSPVSPGAPVTASGNLAL